MAVEMISWPIFGPEDRNRDRPHARRTVRIRPSYRARPLGMHSPGICLVYKWAAAWRTQQNDLCAQRRLRSAQSDQSLGCPDEGAFGCSGSSESSLGARVILLVLSCWGSIDTLRCFLFNIKQNVCSKCGAKNLEIGLEFKGVGSRTCRIGLVNRQKHQSCWTKVA